jgi:formate hydrogenlyase subunit 3/multisubunit Na+/H+ antiporter MnhD subunit
MVGPIYIIAIALGLAFLLGFFKKLNANIAQTLMMAGVGAMSFISVQWLFGHLTGMVTETVTYTAGFKPPFSISLQMGAMEAGVAAMINIFGFLGGVYLWRKLRDMGLNAIIIYMVTLMGLNVIVLTRDLFNLFVFLEVSTIGIAGLILLERGVNTLSAGFKYLVAGGVISAFMLIGTIMVYNYAGSLYINDIINSNVAAAKGGMVALFLLLMAVILELKPFPANGWALDVYESANSGISGFLSAGFATAMLFVLYKLMPIFPEQWKVIIAFIGGITFVLANLLGIRQNNAQRLLGYSSVGQMGLMTAIIGLSTYLGDKFIFILVTILLSHYLAKAGLFWLAGIAKEKEIKSWSLLRKEPLLVVLFGVFALTLLGMPPFPSFFGKWELVMKLAASGKVLWIAGILIGSFFEAVYLFKWFGFVLKGEREDSLILQIKPEQIIAPVVFATIAVMAGYYAGNLLGETNFAYYIPLLFIAGISLLEFLPAFMKNILAIAGMGYLAYETLPGFHENDMLRFIFMSIFIVGGILTLIAGFHYKGKRKGFFPSALIMFAGLAGIIQAETLLQFFFSWELMTIGSYFLIIRGKKSIKHAFSYMLFSLGGAYLILAAFGMVDAQVGGMLNALSGVTSYSSLIFILLVIGFMTKTATVGLHIWLPGAHAEAETDVSPMVSGILLKAGVFGLILVMLSMGSQFVGKVDVYYVLAWLGAISAVMGNMMAAFQEDAKRLLAYSSIGFLGYIVFGLSFMSHLGWLGAISLSIVHFMFKTLLFLAIGGVVIRVKTKEMYKMGGLIKRMPFTFISVLMGIIVISGVPPLTGFGGKWILYNAIMEKGWFFPSVLVFFAGIVAFLYCFRLIHTVFLGQLKDEHREVKEAPFWILAPQYIILGVIMLFSALPNSLLKPIGELLTPIFPDGALNWDGQLATNAYGYWNGQLIMYIVMGIFVTVFVWLWYMNRNAQKVKQFNIGYSAERPSLPETTHFAYNFFAPYKKALGFLVAPVISNFWDRVAEAYNAVADKIRQLYNGNAQTYAFHIVAYIVVIYLITF